MTTQPATGKKALASTLANGYRTLRRRIPHQSWAALRGRVHPALRNELRRRLAPSVPSHGRISVVIPCYNVEHYLPACLNSVISQTYQDLEIIVVIDGSPDSSGTIARQYGRWDRRIRVVEQANAGLGAARNTGIRLATGDYLAFVDSDDTVPTDAYEVLVSSLRRSGSDFAVGNLCRQRGKRTWVPVWAQDVHRRDRLGLTLTEAPEILADVFSWNKLFRRSFFLAHVGGFPEGVRYEDQEPTAKAYASARSFDVLSAVTYRWFIRDDGTSITQQKSNPKDLRDRLEVMRRVANVLTERADESVLRYWQAKSVGLDMRAYYNEVPRTGQEFWDLLRAGVSYVTRSMEPEAWSLVHLHDRLLARMVEADEREDVCTALVLRSELGDGMVVDMGVDPPSGRPLYLDQIRFQPSERDLVLAPGENRLRAMLTGYLSGQDTITVEGVAYVGGAALTADNSTLTAQLVDDRNGEQLPLAGTTIERTSDPAFDELASNAALSQAGSGFRVVLPVVEVRSALATLGVDSDVSPELHLELSLAAGGSQWTGPLLTRDQRGMANRLLPGPLEDGVRIVARFADDVGLLLGLVRSHVAVQDLRLHGREVELDIAAHAAAGTIESVTARCDVLGLQVTSSLPPGTTGGPVRLVFPSLPPGAQPHKQYRWSLEARAGGQVAPVAWHTDAQSLAAAVPAAGLVPRVDRRGHLELMDRKMDALVLGVDVSADAETFVVRGLAHLPAGQPFLLTLTTGSEFWAPEATEWDPLTGRFSACFAVTATVFGQAGVARDSGAYTLRLLAQAGTTVRSVWVPVMEGRLPDVTPGFLSWHAGAHASIRFTLTSTARALWVHVRPPLPEQEWLRVGQRRLQESVPTLLRSPLEDRVLFSTFGGKAPADSPLAIYRELRERGHDRLTWALADGSDWAPDGASSVLIGSTEYYEALHTSRWLVNNNNFPYYFRKRPDQFYLQTWHGTPLKRIGAHVPAANLSLSYRALMRREAQAWDVLLAQNDFSSRIFPEAFAYEGKVLTLGYPRNDRLATATELQCAAVRQRLGLDPHELVVLYAPTWRDNIRTASRRYASVSYLDLPRISAHLSDGGRLLIRGHSNTPGFSSAGEHANILDVTAYPDIADLMAVADILVTDYSSAMFDFAVTGRPIIFLVPDLEEYAGTTRGFYLDFAEIAPGPLATTTEQVVDLLSSPETLKAPFADRYAAFAERFVPLDDGSAAARVVDAVWGD